MVRHVADELPIERHREPLVGHIDRRHDVLVLSLRRQREGFPEDVEAAIAADEPDQVVPPDLGLGQRALGRCLGSREPERAPVMGVRP